MTLIFDSRYKGHHFEYIKHVLDFIILQKKVEYIFLLHPKLIALIESHYARELISELLFLPIPTALTPKSLLAELKEEEKLIAQTVNQYQIAKILFMFLDPYQLMIGLRKFHAQNVSGILFNTPLNLVSNSFLGRIKIKFKKWRKINQLRWCLRHKNLSSIYLLNDEYSSNKLNKKLKTTIFKPIIDPIAQSGKKDSLVDFSANFPELSTVNNGKVQCLVFGSISSVKNLPNILKAIQELEETKRRKIVLNIVGPYASLESEEQIEGLINYDQVKSDINIIRVNRFISDLNVIESLFEYNDIILMPYINFFGSSSVLGHAARHEKLVLVPNVGVINNLVCQYNLGVTCDPNTSTSIKDGLINLMQEQDVLTQKARFLDFFDGRTPENFAKTLLLSEINN